MIKLCKQVIIVVEAHNSCCSGNGYHESDDERSQRCAATEPTVHFSRINCIAECKSNVSHSYASLSRCFCAALSLNKQFAWYAKRVLCKNYQWKVLPCRQFISNVKLPQMHKDKTMLYIFSLCFCWLTCNNFCAGAWTHGIIVFFSLCRTG